VAAFAWNRWQAYSGISGSFRVERVAALPWNQWQDSPGIGGNFAVEYACKLLKRGNFSSVEDLQARVLAFIQYFNATMAKPFKWTYEQKLLCI